MTVSLETVGGYNFHIPYSDLRIICPPKQSHDYSGKQIMNEGRSFNELGHVNHGYEPCAWTDASG